MLNRLLATAVAILVCLGGVSAELPTDPPVSDEHTVLLWHFDEGQGETAVDASGNGRDGAISGAEWVEGRFGRALHWGEGDGNVSVTGDLPGITDRFTLECWVKLDALPTGKQPFWAFDVGGRLGSMVIAIRPPGVLYVGTQLGSARNWLIGSREIPVDEWTHLALVYDGPAGKIGTFVNGAIDLEFDVPPDQPPVNFTEGNPFFVRSYRGTDEKLIGAIDEVRLSSTARLFGHRWTARAFLHVLRYRDEVLLTHHVPPGHPDPPVRYRVRIADGAGAEILDGIVTAEAVEAGRGMIPAVIHEGEWRATVTAELASGDEKVMVDRELRFTPPDRSVVDIDEDNVYRHQGERLFPLMAYHVRQKDLAEVASGGFTIAQSFTTTYWPGYERETDGVGFIDAAWQHGMLGVGGGGGIHDPEVGETMLTQYRGEPSVAFWYIDDEPHGPGRQPEDMLARYEQWARWDPTHPHFLLHNRPPEFRRYSPACDIFATDSYPLRRPGDTDMMPVSVWTRAAVDAVANRKPVWIALQCYTTRSTEESTAGRDMLPRLPTIDELRCMSYMALAEGARGLLYYSFDDTYYNRGGIRGVNLAEEFPEFWAGMKGLMAELRAHEAIWTAPYALLDAPACDNDAIVVQRYPLSDGVQGYVLAVNPTREVQELTLTFEGFTGEQGARDLLADRPLPLRDGVITDTLQPLGAACYAIPGVSFEPDA